MPVYFQRLENALKRANEFIDVGKKTRALEILCDVLRSRKHRTWKKEHEEIMMKYLELCVELRMSYVAKEGIYQYKIICQQTNIKSFEDIVRKYLQLAETEAENAREKSQAVAVDEVDDLDNLQTPESLLMSAVSSEDSQDRTDRVVLLPWIRFLWESYRHCLDILRNNPRTERLYHDIAHKAFQFCIKFNRKTEFRKLCENLHIHLDTLKRQQQTIQNQVTHQQQNFINLSNPDSQAMHLETRLVQLDSAIQMELWQEAYKATDDIKKFGLMSLSKKLPKPQLMANYYQKLALVFWKANCPLFHAAALFRLFTLTKELRKNITPEDVQKMASRVVCATLSIPIPPTRPEIDKLVDTEENVIENHQRNLASLLGLTAAPPTRSSLIKDLKRMGVLQHAYQPLHELYQWLEVEFHPLVLCKRVEDSIKFIETCDNSADLSQYVSALKDVTIIRLLKEISQVYQSIQYSRILELCPFIDKIHLEYMVVSAARRNDLQVRIDHRQECFFFGAESRASQGEEIIEGPHLQSMPSEQIRQQLVTMYSVLHKAQAMMEPEKIKQQKAEAKRRVMATYDTHKKADHKTILERHDYIERRKVELEQIGLEREKKEKELEEERRRELRIAEEERMAREAEERKIQMKLKEDLELKKRMALDQLERMKNTDPKLLDGLNDDELSKLKIEDIKSRQMKQLEKERIDQITRQRNFERKIDHFERAKRQEEIPLMVKAYEEWRKKDEEEWEAMETERIQALIAEREQALQHKERLMRMQEDRDAFIQQVLNQRRQIYAEQYAEWKKEVDEEKAKKLAERKERRKIERREAYLRAKKEAEEKKKAEEEKKRKEEERKKREEELKERQKELDRQAKIQLAKQREIEEKLEREKEALAEPKKAEPMRRKDDIPEKKLPPKPADQEANWRVGGGDSKGKESSRGEGRKYISRGSNEFGSSRDSRDEDWRQTGPIDEAPKGFRGRDNIRRGNFAKDTQREELGDTPSRSYQSSRQEWKSKDGGEGDSGSKRGAIYVPKPKRKEANE